MDGHRKKTWKKSSRCRFPPVKRIVYPIIDHEQQIIDVDHAIAIDIRGAHDEETIRARSPGVDDGQKIIDVDNAIAGSVARTALLDGDVRAERGAVWALRGVSCSHHWICATNDSGAAPALWFPAFKT